MSNIPVWAQIGRAISIPCLFIGYSYGWFRTLKGFLPRSSFKDKTFKEIWIAIHIIFAIVILLIWFLASWVQ